MVFVSQLQSAIYYFLIISALVIFRPLHYKLAHNIFENGLKMPLLAGLAQKGPMSLVSLIQQLQGRRGIARVAGDA